jgi:hypothetical protein
VSPFFPAASIGYFPSLPALSPRESPSNNQCIKKHHNPHNQKHCCKSFAPTSDAAYTCCASYTAWASVALPYQSEHENDAVARVTTKLQSYHSSSIQSFLVWIPVAAALGVGHVEMAMQQSTPTHRFMKLCLNSTLVSSVPWTFRIAYLVFPYNAHSK